MLPGLADKTVSRKVLGCFGIGFALALAFALLVFVCVLLKFAALAFLAFAFAFALLVAFAFFAVAFAQHREIHGTTSPPAVSACARQLSNSIVMTCA